MKSIIFTCLTPIFLLIGCSFILLAILAIGYDFSQPMLSDVVAQSRPLDLNTPDPALQGQLVSVSGQLSIKEQLSDNLYLKPAPYLELTRQVEMYAWKEYTRKANHHWVEEWSSSPTSDSRNPEMTLKPQRWRVSRIQIGAYSLDPTDLDLPISEEVNLTPDLLTKPLPIANGYLFEGKGSLAAPEIGDFRFWYEAVPVPDRMVTVYGKLEGQKIVPFPYGDGYPKVYHVSFGDRETSLVTLSQQAVISTWLWRCILGAFGLGGVGCIAAAVAMWVMGRR